MADCQDGDDSAAGQAPGGLFKIVFAARYDFLSTVLYVAMG